MPYAGVNRHSRRCDGRESPPSSRFIGATLPLITLTNHAHPGRRTSPVHDRRVCRGYGGRCPAGAQDDLPERLQEAERKKMNAPLSTFALFSSSVCDGSGRRAAGPRAARHCARGCHAGEWRCGPGVWVCHSRALSACLHAFSDSEFTLCVWDLSLRRAMIRYTHASREHVLSIQYHAPGHFIT